MKSILNVKKSIIVFVTVATMTMGTIAGAATFGVSKYHYSNSNVYGISASSNGFSGYVTTWCKAVDDNSYHYNSSRKKTASSADANVIWDKGILERSAGFTN